MLNVRRPAGPYAARQQSAGGGPVVERMACWSARHRTAVVAGWLLFLGLAFLAGQVLGTQSRPQYDPGPAGQGEQILHLLGVVTPPAESVLIQGRSAAATFASDPQMRQAARAVAAALARLPRAAEDIASPLGPGGRTLISPDGRSALVTFRVAGPSGEAMSSAARGRRASAAATACAACRICGSLANVAFRARGWISTLSAGGVTTPSWCSTCSPRPAWPGSYWGRLCVPSSWPARTARPRNSSQPATTAFRCRALQQATRSTTGPPAEGCRSAWCADGLRTFSMGASGTRGLTLVSGSSRA